MVRTRSMTAVVRRRNLIKTKAAPPKRKAAQPKSKRKPAQAQLKKKAAAAAAAAALSEEQQKMAAAASAVDVEKILRLKKEAIEAIETKGFPLRTKAKLAAAALKAKLAAAEGQTQQSGAEEEKVVTGKKRIQKYLLSQGYIDHMKEAGLVHLVDEIPEEELAKESQVFLEGYRANVFLTQKLQAYQKALLDQYDTFGYAYDVKEVSEAEAEGEEDGEGFLVVNN